MAIHVNNLQDKVGIAAELEETLRDLARTALAAAGRPDAEVGLTLADDASLLELNRSYRGVDAPTDVLSFVLRERTEAEPPHTEAGPDLLGDVVISVERAEAQAREYGRSFRRELGYLAVHGFLHLLGHDHDDEERTRRMRAAEEAILAGWGF